MSDEKRNAYDEMAAKETPQIIKDLSVWLQERAERFMADVKKLEQADKTERTANQIAHLEGRIATLRLTHVWINSYLVKCGMPSLVKPEGWNRGSLYRFLADYANYDMPAYDMKAHQERYGNVNIKDLQVGDWVRCDGSFAKVTSINQNETVDVERDGIHLSDVHVDWIMSIGLTGEMLLKYGWQREGFEFDYTTTNGIQLNICPIYDEGEGYYTVTYKEGDAIAAPDCVHDLQHLLWSLGDRREVKL